MKRAKLEKLLRTKIRLQITRQRRGPFCVTFGTYVYEAKTKKEALTWLSVRLRTLPVFTIKIEKRARQDSIRDTLIECPLS